MHKNYCENDININYNIYIYSEFYNLYTCALGACWTQTYFQQYNTNYNLPELGTVVIEYTLYITYRINCMPYVNIQYYLCIYCASSS